MLYKIRDGVDQSVWKLIWKLNAAPKIKVFLWKVPNNAIPLFLNLYIRKLRDSPQCCICNSPEESMEHLLFRVDAVWFNSPLGLKIDKRRVTTLDAWFLELSNSNRSKADKDCILTVVCFTMWAIWRARCELVYQHVQVSPGSTSIRAKSYMYSYLEATGRLK